MRTRLFNDAEVIWLKQEISKWSLDETVEMFNQAFNRNITYAQLSRANTRYRYGNPNRGRPRRPRRPRLLDDAEIAWLKREYPKRPILETIELFNRTFKRDISYQQLRDANHRLRLGQANQERRTHHFNDAEIAWLKQEIPKWTLRETVEMFNQAFDRNITYVQLRYANHRYGYGRPNRIRPLRARRAGLFNDDEVAWLRREIPKWPLHETVELFNQTFGRDITYNQLRRANHRHKWGSANRTLPRLFNDAELTWLRRVISKWPMDKTVVRFNRKFNRDLTYEQLRDANHRYRLGRANVKHFHNPPEAPTVERPLWSERWRRLGGDRRELWTIMIKVPGPSPLESHRTSGTQQKAHWMPKGRWVWEQANGPIPEGHVVAYVDGDPSNCDLDNLECVLRGAVSIINMVNWPDGLEAEDADSRREKLLLAHARIAAGKRAKEDRR